MTGQEALEQALRLLHYTDQDGQPESRFREDSRHQGLAAVNQVVADLWAVEQEQPFVPLDRLDDTVALSDRACREVLPIGVAMWIAQAEGDSAQQAVLAAAYSQKRGQCGTPSRRRQDVIPWGESA